MTTTNDDASATPPVATGTIQVWSDLLCPFAYVGLLWLRRARERLGLDGVVRLEHRTFPLELFNGPHPRRGTDTEAVGLGQIEPDAEFRVWAAADRSGPDARFPDGVRRLRRPLRRGLHPRGLLEADRRHALRKRQHAGDAQDRLTLPFAGVTRWRRARSVSFRTGPR